jgi:hypothetical protein
VLPPTSHCSDLYIVDSLIATSHIPSAMPWDPSLAISRM